MQIYFCINRMQIYFCIKQQAKYDFPKDVKRRVTRYPVIGNRPVQNVVEESTLGKFVKG